MIFTFWFCLLAIAYCYFIYPVLIQLTAKLIPRPVNRATITPSVTVVICVYNEEMVIAGKIQNLLSMEYPTDKIQILIGSDGSDDKTNDIVRGLNNPQVVLFPYPERRGKMAMIDDLIHQARGEIIIFNDARQTISKDAFKNLVSNFADPAVGCASGELLFHTQEGNTAKGINLYWEYEKFIRRHESIVHSMLGATGAIYAIRKSLFIAGPRNVILDDMYIPLKVIEQGHRAIFDKTAHAYDLAAQESAEEYRRKVRTLSGNYQIFFMFPGLFNPFTSPIAIQLFSHKLLRVLVPFLMIAVFIINIFLLDCFFYAGTFVAQIIFYAAAATAFLLKGKKYGILSKLTYVPYVFCLLNYSALMGFYRFITSKQESTWQKAKQ